MTNENEIKTVRDLDQIRAFVRSTMPAYGDGKGVQELADALGLSQQYIHIIRNGTQRPKIEMLLRILAVTRPRVRLALIENEAA